MEARLIRYEKDTIEGEILTLIKKDALPLLERLLAWAEEHESKALYLKLKADCLRYLAEMLPGKEREAVVEDAKYTYEQARSESEYLLSTHSLRLACALN